MTTPDANTPPVPHMVEGGLAWNNLNPADRAALMGLWRSAQSQPPGQLSLLEQDPTTENADRVSDLEGSTSEVRAHNFWERGWVDVMPSLDEVLADTYEHPDQYNRTIFYDPKTLACPLTSNYRGNVHGTVAMSERDAIRDLSDYLDDVMAFSQRNGDLSVESRIRRFRENLGYLSEAAFEEAVTFIADAMVGELIGNPELVYNVFSLAQAETKSGTYVYTKVYDELQRRLQGRPELASRVRVLTSTWVNSPSAKIVIFDDWVISGNTCQKAMDEVDERAKAMWPKGFIGTKEALVLARSATCVKPNGFDYRSVYMQGSEGGPHFREVSMVGAHATVNYGYEQAILRFQEYMHEHDVFIQAPHLFRIEPTEYRQERVRRVSGSEFDIDLLNRIAEENVTYLEVLNNIEKLEEEVATIIEAEDKRGLHHKLAKANSSDKPYPEDMSSLPEEARRKLVEILNARMMIRQMSARRENLRTELGFGRGAV